MPMKPVGLSGIISYLTGLMLSSMPVSARKRLIHQTRRLSTVTSFLIEWSLSKMSMKWD